MPELVGLYKALAIHKLTNNAEFTLTDLIKVKGLIDINEFLTKIDLQDGDENQLDYEKGLGLRDDDDLTRLMEHFDIFEVIEGNDESYRYVRPDNGEDLLFKLKVHHATDSDGYHDTFFDFNTIEEADEDEFLDQDALDAFFQSATFLVSPGKEDEGAPYKFLWDDFDAVNERIRRATENNETLFVYTLQEEGSSGGYIDAGYMRVNRMGYFLADKLIPMPEPLRYW
ncbi:hypothetical protein [Heyndrickxia sporothermodurans]|uniref:hypothetical protein n=1 Tax=Heyndrickxia sporothermodurans TaxID=46224 RepID=UPI000D3A7524|nr:hypothetical protein [Heyndrickxia sporothermodurans]PTY93025.1 hypothetical protein B5V90_02780 [Heyndrickxia sporothermodurans]